MNCLHRQAVVSLLYQISSKSTETFAINLQNCWRIFDNLRMIFVNRLMIFRTLRNCAAIVRSVRVIFRKDSGDVHKYVHTRSGLDAPRKCSEKSLVIFAYLRKASRWPQTAFEILWMTVVVFDCLRTNLENLRCNLHLFYIFCTVVHLNCIALS